MAKEAAQPTFSQKQRIFGRFWSSFFVHFGVQNRLKNESPPRQGGSLASWGPQGASRGHFGPILGGFWEALGSILKALWVILGVFLKSSSNKRSKKQHTKQKRNKQQPKLQQTAGNMSQHQQKACLLYTSPSPRDRG